MGLQPQTISQWQMEQRILAEMKLSSLMEQEMFAESNLLPWIEEQMLAESKIPSWMEQQMLAESNFHRRWSSRLKDHQRQFCYSLFLKK
jgi:hypothetical protein